MTKEIPILSKGETFIALVDDEDYPVVSRHKWYILWLKELPYAFTRLYNEDKKNGKTLLMPHLILGSCNQVDHENHNTLDNQKRNLRPATYQQNGWNKVKPNFKGRNSSSKYKGVVYAPLKGEDRWAVLIKHVEPGQHKSTGKVIRVGYFFDEDEAARAYNKKVAELRGEYAWLNPVPELAENLAKSGT